MSLLCAISGEAPTHPVASTKSGTVFERRLIEAYITEHGKDPVTGEELTTADLVDLKSPRTIRPRPPTLTSIPTLLETFQNEWDALALETHSLRQQLTQTRQELSTALYQHDAATRVIARLLKERDEARDALSKVTVSAGGAPAANGDQMDVDQQEVPVSIQETVDATKAELSATRKKRAIPADWVTAETVASFETISTSEPLFAGVKAVALDTSGELALLGGADGTAMIYSVTQQQQVAPLKAEDGAINDVAWAGKRAVTGSGAGVVRIWDDQGSSSTAFNSHAGEVTAVAMHPSGAILASTGVDKSWVMYDLNASKAVTQIYDEHKLICAEFHPDGHLFAAGAVGTPAEVKIYDVRSGSSLASFGPLSGPVSSVNFSENGFWLALSVQGQSTVEIWDLRKMAQTKALEVGTQVEHVSWDYTGQFLAAIGPSGVSVQNYAKASKSWSEPLRSAVPGVAAAWGSRGSNLVTVNSSGVLTVLGTKE